MKAKLTTRDFELAGRRLRVPPAALMAVAEVEGGSTGFLRDGQPVILFEAHHFSRLTDHAFDSTHPKISSRRWDRRLYATGTPEQRGQREHKRLAEAITLDREAALQSASWGLFQVMGFNWRDLRYRSLQEFINAMYRSEADHLESLERFISFKRLDDELRRLDWPAFARGYNGPGYAANKYDVKMAQAYRRYAAAPRQTRPDFSNVRGGVTSTERDQ